MKREYYLKPVNVISAIIIIALTFNACTKKQDNKEKLAHLYIDLLTVEEFYHGIPDSIKKHQQLLFDKYSISSDEFSQRLEQMKTNREEWEEFFKKAEKYLNDKIERTKKKKDKSTVKN